MKPTFTRRRAALNLFYVIQSIRGYQGSLERYYPLRKATAPLFARSLWGKKKKGGE